MSGRILADDPIVAQRVNWHEEGDSVVIDTKQDVESIMELNKDQFNQSDGTFGGDMKHVARIPLVVMEDLIRRNILKKGGGVKDEKRFKAWLNDRDNRVWRTHPGRI